jgi:hypothetical protein
MAVNKSPRVICAHDTVSYLVHRTFLHNRPCPLRLLIPLLVGCEGGVAAVAAVAVAVVVLPPL